MEHWLQILLQIPLVAAFMWFVLERDKRDRDERDKRDQRDQEYRQLRDQEWRDFLAGQREVNVAALADLSREMQGAVEGLQSLQMAAVQHDIMTREVLQKVLVAREIDERLGCTASDGNRRRLAKQG
jgi:hypothetical protein